MNDHDPHPAPLSESLNRAALARRSTGCERRWASRKRQILETRLPELQGAHQAGLSLREIREQLAKDGVKVGRWLLADIMRGLVEKAGVNSPSGPAATRA